MFKLTEAEFECAFQAIEHHGFSTLLPDPPEWEDLKNDWENIKKQLTNEDLDSYVPHVPLRVFAPKNRYNLRVVTHLHPLDLLIYTALTLIVRDDIEQARIPSSRKKVFSFRSKKENRNELYDA